MTKTEFFDILASRTDTWGKIGKDCSWDSTIRMNSEEFKRQYHGVFLPDKRQVELQMRLDQYYRDTPDEASNKDVRLHWDLFKRWCNERGYKLEEINKAKRDSRQI